MVIKTYTNQAAANFYIQNKGDNSGRPSRKPLRNSFAIFTDVENAFEIAYCVWIASRYYPFIHGSVIPTIRIEAVKQVLKPALERHNELNKDYLTKLAEIDKLIEVNTIKDTLYRQWRKTIAFETLSVLK
jgi:hypothetical protein